MTDWLCTCAFAPLVLANLHFLSAQKETLTENKQQKSLDQRRGSSPDVRAVVAAPPLAGMSPCSTNRIISSHPPDAACVRACVLILSPPREMLPPTSAALPVWPLPLLCFLFLSSDLLLHLCPKTVLRRRTVRVEPTPRASKCICVVLSVCV